MAPKIMAHGCCKIIENTLGGTYSQTVLIAGR
jgi:hypothetical protein